MDLRLDWEGKSYQLDPESITAREYKAIKRHTGLSVNKFWTAIERAGEDTEAEVIDVLRWLFLTRAGQTVDLETDDDYSLSGFLTALAESNVSLVADSGDDAPKAGGGAPTSI